MDEPDWIDDPNLSSDERLSRFEALGPQATRGPHHFAMTYSGAVTTVYINGVRQGCADA